MELMRLTVKGQCILLHEKIMGKTGPQLHQLHGQIMLSQETFLKYLCTSLINVPPNKIWDFIFNNVFPIRKSREAVQQLNEHIDAYDSDVTLKIIKHIYPYRIMLLHFRKAEQFIITETSDLLFLRVVVNFYFRDSKSLLQSCSTNQHIVLSHHSLGKTFIRYCQTFSIHKLRLLK